MSCTDDPREPPGGPGEDDPGGQRRLNVVEGALPEPSGPPASGPSGPPVAAPERPGLTSVEPEPPGEDPSSDDWRGDWYRALVRGKEVENENERDFGRAKVRGMDTTRHERYFLMGLSAFGAVAGVAMAALGVAHDNPDFYLGTAAGSLVAGGGLLRLTIIAPGARGRRGKRGKRGKRG